MITEQARLVEDQRLQKMHELFDMGLQNMLEPKTGVLSDGQIRMCDLQKAQSMLGIAVSNPNSDWREVAS